MFKGNDLKGNDLPLNRPEDVLAEIAAATSRLISRCGVKGAFIDIELDLWHAVQKRLHRIPRTGPGEGPVSMR